ncbi:hypothetical protein FACS189418_0970 [Clostridia bacterium]|nr:hypothetical protein FACS189418_0970 [Clostridia bacterium]
MIKNNENKGDFTHVEVTKDMLDEAEKELNLNMPKEYVWFLQQFGHGGIEVIGVGKNKTLTFVKETLKYRMYGLPSELITIENCDEWVYCINSIDEKIVKWSQSNSRYIEVFDNFEAYLQDRMNDILENM